MGTLVDVKQYLNTSHYGNLKVVYDIGASDGHYSREVFNSVGSNPKFYLFEADPKYADQKHYFDFEFHNVLLSDKEKTVDFYSNGTGGDSYYPEITGVYNDVKPVQRQAVKLDDYVEKHNIPLPDLIKIDTQGSELDILIGGSKCMNNAKVIILECPVLLYNQGAPTFDQYIGFMQSKGFLPQDVTEIHWLGGIMVQLDIAFINVGEQQ